MTSSPILFITEGDAKRSATVHSLLRKRDTNDPRPSKGRAPYRSSRNQPQRVVEAAAAAAGAARAAGSAIGRGS